MKSIAKMLIHILRVVRIDLSEMLKDIRYCGFHRDHAQKLGWRMLLLAHSLEKGLGIPNRRVDFGRKKAQDLLRYLRAYCKKKTSGGCVCIPGSACRAEALSIGARVEWALKRRI